MATSGPAAPQTSSGSAPRRCPLCACELPFLSVVGSGSASCANCGFDLGQVGVTRRKAEEQIAAAAKPKIAKLDSLDRWLAGESIQPKNPTEKEQFANWLRRHPQFTTALAAFLVAAVVVPVASFTAYRRTAL